MFKKNSMEFFIGLDYYLYLFYSGCTTTSLQSYDLPECSMVTWSCHMIWLPKLPYYLFLNPIVQLEILDEVFECIGNCFLFGALITLVWVNKKNLIEFPFDYCTLLIHILYLLLFIKFYTSLLSYFLLCIHWLLN